MDRSPSILMSMWSPRIFSTDAEAKLKKGGKWVVDKVEDN